LEKPVSAPQEAAIAARVPAGWCSYWPAPTPPDGYLIRDGSAISRTAYSALFAVLGTTFGAGDGSTTFNLPDDRGRVIAGYKSGDANFGTFGAAIGEAMHLLTSTESGVPPHNHPPANAGESIIAGSASGNVGYTAGTTLIGRFSTGSNTAQNASAAHNNIQPTRIYLPIIKY